MKKTNNKQKAVEEKAVAKVNNKGIPTNGIWGILLLTVAISSGYLAFLVLTGTDGLLNQIMAGPTVVAIALFLIFKAIK